jgi:hypothetical protein
MSGNVCTGSHGIKLQNQSLMAIWVKKSGCCRALSNIRPVFCPRCLCYKLGMRQHLLDIGPGQCSRLAEGSIWNLIWKSPVPQKIRVFGRRLIANSLAVGWT